MRTSRTPVERSSDGRWGRRPAGSGVLDEAGVCLARRIPLAKHTVIQVT
jgi:hypothetical protein